MKFIELFAGIGGFRLGLERTGHECVWANEWLEKPRRIYAKQFGHKPDDRDIRTIRAEDIPEADFICGGFPCATFSIAGKRAGFSLEDTRGTLAFEMFRLARDRGIPYILFENVKGLLNHDNGRTFGVILEVLDGMGYDSQWELLDSQNFGVPQHRERIFLIANLRGKPRPKVFPITEEFGKNDEENFGKQETRAGIFSNISPTLDAHYYKGGASRQYVNEEAVAQWRRTHFREYRSDGVPTLTANMGTGGNNVPFIVSPTITCENAHGFGMHVTPFQSKAIAKAQGISEEQIEGEYLKIKDNKVKSSLIRKLTPIECERLQGLPDDYTKWLKMDDGCLRQNSDADRYERCGRTVTIGVIEAIGRKFGYEWY